MKHQLALVSLLGNFYHQNRLPSWLVFMSSLCFHGTHCMQHRVISYRDWFGRQSAVHSFSKLPAPISMRCKKGCCLRPARFSDDWRFDCIPGVPDEPDLRFSCAWICLPSSSFGEKCYACGFGWVFSNKRLPRGHVYTIRWNCEFGDGLPHGDFVGCVI